MYVCVHADDRERLSNSAHDALRNAHTMSVPGRPSVWQKRGVPPWMSVDLTSKHLQYVRLWKVLTDMTMNKRI